MKNTLEKFLHKGRFVLDVQAFFQSKTQCDIGVGYTATQGITLAM